MKLDDDRKDWPEGAREDFEERAGILEFSAGLTRTEAERTADRITRKAWKDAV